METDNAYPRSTSSFIKREPIEQQVEKTREAIEISSQIGLIRDIHTHLKSRVAFYGSIDAVDLGTTLNPEEFMHTVAANKLAKSVLDTELTLLESVIADYKEEQHIQ